MKKIITIVLLSVLLVTIFSFSSVASADDSYQFDKFDVEIIVNSDYTFDVIEKVTANFNQEKHGIYRSLYNFWGEDRVRYSNISVQGAKYKIEKDRDSTNIRIGDANEYVIGVQHYIIEYTISLPKDSNNEIDSVYMNVFGYDHPVVTKRANLKITLPFKVDPSYTTVISGFYYDSGISDKITYSYMNRKELFIEINSPLEAYEGITVKMDLPEGYFVDVKDPFFFDVFVETYLPWILILAGLFIWIVYGRDKQIIMPVEVNAPDVSPIEAGYVIDGVVDGDDVAAMLIYWASKGFIQIEETGKKGDYKFTKLSSIKDCPAYERTLFNKLFLETDNNQTVTTSKLKSRLAKQSTKIKKDVKKKYTKGKDTLLNKKSTTLSKFVIFLAYICFGMIGFFIGLAEHISVGIMLFFFFMFPFIFIHTWLSRILTYSRKKRVFSNVGKLIFFSLIMLVAWVFVFAISENTMLSYSHSLVMFFGALLLVVIGHYTQKLSPNGHTLYERVLGFRHFMLTAEKDWIETLAEEDPEFFYSKLPYALVLGVSRVWIGKFANYITTPPSWYVGNVSAFNARTFSSQLSSNFTKIGASAVPRSTSSGSYRSGGSSSFSSGGGFSGGGFSGGGSSSW